MLVIGITGQFCSGKSTAAKMFAKLGAKVLDADEIGHKALLDKLVREELINHFGCGIKTKNGAINRKQLAKEAFKNKANHKALCGIVHPRLVKLIKERLDILKLKDPNSVVVIDAAVLLEMGLLRYVDKLIVVKINRLTQIKRANSKWKLSRADALRRINLQMPFSYLSKKADFIIDNSRDLKGTNKQVEKIWKDLSLVAADVAAQFIAQKTANQRHKCHRYR